MPYTQNSTHLEETEIISSLLNSVINDLSNLYEGGRLEESFYWFILASNPKFYPISGLQHYLGTGFIASRLASFLGFNEYHIATSFLGGIFHDFNKWFISLEEVRKNVYEKLETTGIYNAITKFLGKSKADEVFDNAIEIGLKLESGGLPRRLQKISEVIRIADILTGSKESWSIPYCVNKLLSINGIEVNHILPVVVGKQRPIVSIVSEVIEEELKNLDATPLISTPEGMIFLTKKRVNITKVYDRVTNYIIQSTRSESMKTEEKTKLDIFAIQGFLGGHRKLSTYSRKYGSLASYMPDDVRKAFEDARKSGLSDVRLFIIVLAYIYSKDPDKKEGSKERLKRFIEKLKLKKEDKERLLRKLGNVSNALKELYEVLKGINRELLLKIAEEATDFIICEMRKYREIDVDLLKRKLSYYINIGYEKKELEEIKGDVCRVCREPVIIGKSLTSFLQELRRNAIKGINVSEMFHPDIQGKPEVAESIGYVGKLPVCEVCYFEAITAPKQISYMDGLWASVLLYYPAVSTDLLNAVRKVLEKKVKFEKRELTVIPDYMTSRIILSRSEKALDKSFLRDSLDFWFFFGGNLTVTTNALSSAFTGTNLPIELELTDVVMEEAVMEYINILKKAKSNDRYLRFTREIRYWLYKTLKDYVNNLGEKGGTLRTSSTRFSRSGLQTTGFAVIDTYSFILNQSKKKR